MERGTPTTKRAVDLLLGGAFEAALDAASPLASDDVEAEAVVDLVEYFLEAAGQRPPPSDLAERWPELLVEWRTRSGRNPLAHRRTLDPAWLDDDRAYGARDLEIERAEGAGRRLVLNHEPLQATGGLDLIVDSRGDFRPQDVAATGLLLGLNARIQVLFELSDDEAGAFELILAHRALGNYQRGYSAFRLSLDDDQELVRLFEAPSGWRQRDVFPLGELEPGSHVIELYVPWGASTLYSLQSVEIAPAE